MEKQLNEAFDYIRRLYDKSPGIGIILGTGLGGLVEEIEIERSISYNHIPHFPISTVESHFGRLIFGKIGGKDIVAMQGRFHFYEGYSMAEITFPLRVLKMLGIHTLFISNAAGGLNPTYRKGDLMILDDHINLQTANPLTGPNLDKFGPRFPDMSQPYDKTLIARAEEIAKQHHYPVHTGVYVAVIGPNLETRAEYRFLRMIGGDVVGMSTVPEVIVANHMSLRTFAISVITDECDPDHLEPVDVAEIIRVAGEAEPKMTHILSSLIRSL
ncbi:MAG: purine-nucleoside phosphorylase [Bacteroidetes bacterium]|nr:MAG: purine-nucleoside phosphorylase [Bacteroidota bacterium]